MRREVEPGFALNLECWGEGPPLVLLHGFTGSARAWGPFADALAAENRVIAVDIAGHGLSDAPSAIRHYHMQRAVEDVVAAVKFAGYGRAAWLGYSMGGRLALHVAAAHPEAVGSAILIGASPGIAEAGERAQRVAADEELARRIEADGVPAFIDYWENIPLFASQLSLPEATRAAIRAGRLGNSAEGLANSLRGMGAGAQEPLKSALPKMAMPMLLLAGDNDAKYTAIAGEMAAALPHARAVVVPGAGHAAHLEQPERCVSVIRSFLAETASDSTIPSTPSTSQGART